MGGFWSGGDASPLSAFRGGWVWWVPYLFGVCGCGGWVFRLAGEFWSGGDALPLSMFRGWVGYLGPQVFGGCLVSGVLRIRERMRDIVAGASALWFSPRCRSLAYSTRAGRFSTRRRGRDDDLVYTGLPASGGCVGCQSRDQAFNRAGPECGGALLVCSVGVGARCARYSAIEAGVSAMAEGMVRGKVLRPSRFDPTVSRCMTVHRRARSNCSGRGNRRLGWGSASGSGRVF